MIKCRVPSCVLYFKSKIGMDIVRDHFLRAHGLLSNYQFNSNQTGSVACTAEGCFKYAKNDYGLTVHLQ